MFGGPVLPDHLVARKLRSFGKGGQHIVYRLAPIQGSNQRLNYRDGAVIGRRITPIFVGVRFGNVPLANFGSFVFMRAQTNPQFRHLNRTAQIHFRRSIEDRIAAQNHEQLNLAAVQIRQQRVQVSPLVSRLSFKRSGQHHGGADVAERLIDEMNQRVNFRRLVFTRNHNRLALVRQQVLREGVEELRAGSRTTAHRSRKRPGKSGYLRGLNRLPVIGFRARGSGCRFDCVETTLRFFRAAHGAFFRPVTRITHATRAVGKEVAVDGQNNVSLIELVNGIDELAKCLLRTHAATMSGGFPLVPFRARIQLEYILNLRVQRRRRDRFGEDANAGTRLRTLFFEYTDESGKERRV